MPGAGTAMARRIWVGTCHPASIRGFLKANTFLGRLPALALDALTGSAAARCQARHHRPPRGTGRQPEAHPEAIFEIIRALCEKVRAGAAPIEDSTLEMRARVARGLQRLAHHSGRR